MNSDHGTVGAPGQDADHGGRPGDTTPISDGSPHSASALDTSDPAGTTDPADRTDAGEQTGTGDEQTVAERTRPAGPDGETPAPRQRPAKIEHTRTAGTWAAVVVAIVVLVVLLIFILQNGQQATVSFLGGHASLPLGVALLMAAAIGGLLVALIGTARILQLRRTARKRP